MKITTQMFFDRFLSGIQRNMEAVISDNEQISTGKKINRPSDDPSTLVRIINYKTQLASLGEYKRTIDAAKGPLQAFDSAFENLNGILQRASELAIGGASSTTDANSKLMISKEVDMLYQRAIGIANTKIGDRYIFSGFQSNVAPIDANSGEFVGDSNTLQLNIGVGINISANVSAGDLFSFKRAYTTDSSNAILPSYNWNNNGSITIPYADPVSALYTSSGSFVNSSDVFTANGGALSIKVGDSSQTSAGGFMINAANNIINIDGANRTIPGGIYTGAGLAAALSGLVAGVAFNYDSSSHSFSINGAGHTVDLSASNSRSILGFNSAPVQTLSSTGIKSDFSVGDVNLAANATLNDVRNTINTAVAGVKAEVVNFGTLTGQDYRLVVASNPVGSSDKIKVTVSTTDAAGTGLNRLSYDKSTTVNMTLGTDIKNYNYFSDLSTANDSIAIDSSNNAINIKEGALSGTATVTPGTYSATQLAAAIKTALEAATASANTYAVAYDPNARKFTITSNGANLDTLTLYWSNTASTARQLLGYNAADVNVAPGSSDVSNNAVLANYYSFNNNYLNQNNILRALNFLKVSLESNDAGRIGKAIGYVNTVSEKVYQTAADIGSRLNKIDAEEKYQGDVELNVNTYLSNDQDTDFGKVVSDIAQRQNALQGLRTISTDFLKTSLFDFLK